MSARNFLCVVLFLFTSLSRAESFLDPKLAPLEPFLNKEWTGMMKAPDGTAAWKTVFKFEVVWSGTVIKSSRATPEMNSFEEGFIYWDDLAKQPAFFSIHCKGIYRSGFVSVEKNVITFAGRISWPAPPANPGVKQSFDFRNTFEMKSETEMVDRWFQNAFGSWRPGHVVEFTAKVLGSVQEQNIEKARSRLGDRLLQNADAVIAKYLEAIGGRDAILAITSLMVKGRNTRFGQGDMPLCRYYEPPNLFKQTRSPEDVNFIASNGEKTWAVSPEGRRELTEWWAISLKHNRIDGNFIDYKSRGIKYDYVGLEGFATEPFVYYHLLRTFPDGFSEDLYFDVETGLLHAIWTTSSPIKDSPQVFYDYRKVGGVLFPHAWMRVHDKAAPPHLFIVEEIKLNEDFGKDFFKCVTVEGKKFDSPQ